MNLSTAILGVGALGGLWAVRLSAAGLTLTLIGPQAVSPLRRLTLEAQGEPPQSALLEQQTPEQLRDSSPSIDLLLVMTKSGQTLAALRALRPSLKADCRIVLFQNGLGTQMQVLSEFNAFPLFAATTTEGANRQSRDLIVHAGRGTTAIGALNDIAARGTLLSEVVTLLASSGLAVQAHPDIWQALWQKLVINCAINPFTALCDCRNGAVPDQPLFQSLWPQLRKELANCLALADYPESEQSIEHRVQAVIQSTAQNVSSMLQDVRAGRPTEIDAINGFVCEFLESRGYSSEANRALWRGVRQLRP